MKRGSILCALTSGVLLATLPATAETNQQSATVVSITNCPAVSENALSDAPLRAVTYLYSIGIQQDNVLYHTAYESAFENAPPVLAHQPVQVSRKGGVLYVTLPGKRTVPMTIETRTVVNNTIAHSY